MYEVNNLNFAEIAYETKTTIPNIQVIGDMYVKRTVDSNGNLSFGFSNDGVYFVEIPIQGDFAFAILCITVLIKCFTFWVIKLYTINPDGISLLTLMRLEMQ